MTFPQAIKILHQSLISEFRTCAAKQRKSCFRFLQVGLAYIEQSTQAFRGS